jgi:hypothetical protein
MNINKLLQFSEHHRFSQTAGGDGKTPALQATVSSTPSPQLLMYPHISFLLKGNRIALIFFLSFR